MGDHPPPGQRSSPFPPSRLLSTCDRRARTSHPLFHSKAEGQRDFSTKTPGNLCAEALLLAWTGVPDTYRSTASLRCKGLVATLTLPLRRSRRRVARTLCTRGTLGGQSRSATCTRGRRSVASVAARPLTRCRDTVGPYERCLLHHGRPCCGLGITSMNARARSCHPQGFA